MKKTLFVLLLAILLIFSLQIFVNAAESTITLTETLEITSEMKINSGDILTIEGNGNTITYGKKADETYYLNRMFNIADGGKLILNNVVIDGGNNWTIDEAKYNASMIVYQKGVASTDYIAPESPTAPVSTGLIYTKGELQLNNTTIKNYYAKTGAAIVANQNGSIYLKKSTITHCASLNSTVAINIDGKNVFCYIEDGTIISDNWAKGNAGLFRVYSSAKCFMNDGKIINNRALDTNGIVVMCHGSGSTFTLNDGLIKGNSIITGSSNTRNPIIYMHNAGTFIMNGGIIEENHGQKYGAIDLPGYPTSKIELNGGVIRNNIANLSYGDYSAMNLGADYNFVLQPKMTIIGNSGYTGSFTNNGNVTGLVSINTQYGHPEIVYTGTGSLDGDLVIYHSVEDWINNADQLPNYDKNTSISGYVEYCNPKYQALVWSRYNGGTNSINKSYRLNAVVMGTVPDLEIPTKEGYTFAGWYLDEALTKKWENTPITERTYLYASWTPNKHEIVFEVDGKKEIIESVYGEEITPPTTEPVKKGHTFMGWQSFTPGMTTPNNSLTFIALWKPNKYNITFPTDDVDGVQVVTQEYGTQFKEPEWPVSTNGKYFAGWFLDKELTKPYDFNQTIEGDLVLYAKWSDTPLISSNPAVDQSQSQGVQTGDNIIIYIAILVIAIISLTITFIPFKKKLNK